MNNPKEKIVKIKPFTRKWEKLANELARSYCPEIIDCKKCGHPVIKGYCCGFCMTDSPYTRAS